MGDQMGNSAPEYLKPCFACCGGPVGTLEKFTFVIPAGSQRDTVNSAIAKYNGLSVRLCRHSFGEYSSMVSFSNAVQEPYLRGQHHTWSLTYFQPYFPLHDPWGNIPRGSNMLPGALQHTNKNKKNVQSAT